MRLFAALGQRNNDELWPQVIYKRRGSTLELPDGQVVLFMGGAESTDREWRVEQERAGGEKLLFAEERITEIALATEDSAPEAIVVAPVETVEALPTTG